MTHKHLHWQISGKSTTYRYGVVIFIGAIIVRFFLIFLLHPYHNLDRFELERTALSLANSGIYGNPYALPTGPTAHVSPGYTVLLAGLFHFFGSGVQAEIIKEVLASLVAACGCALIPAASRALLLGDRTGLAAGLLCALLPIKPLVQIDGDWETCYTALFLTMLAVLVTRKWMECDLSTASALKQGLLWGLALLFSSVLLPVFIAVLLAGLLWFGSSSRRRYLKMASLQLLMALLCLSPWIVRNQMALGSPISTRSNFGIELHVSNNDEAGPDQRVNYDRGVYDHFHPLQNVREALKVRQLGEVAYNRMVLQQTDAWISTHRSRFIQLCAERLFDFWFYPDPSKLKALFGDLTAVLGFAGLYQAYRNQPKAGVMAAILLLTYPLPSYLVHVGARQRYPIDWLLTLLSVYALFRGWRRYRVERQSPPSSLEAS